MTEQDLSPHSNEVSNLTEWHTYSLQQSADALIKADIASEEEVSTIQGQCIQAWERNLAAEPLFRLAALEDEDESQYEASIERWSTVLASLVHPPMPPAPFASQMMTPTAFYEKHEPLFELARSFQCPILYTEDADVIGIGSINPVTATIFAQAVHAYVHETLGIAPYITCVRMNYESWKSLNAKHFNR